MASTLFSLLTFLLAARLIVIDGFVNSPVFRHERLTLRKHHFPTNSRTKQDTQLYAAGEPGESTISGNTDADPREALEQFGVLFAQVQAIVTEGSSWDAETLEAKTQEFVRTYLKVFVPGVGYVISSTVVYFGTFLLLSSALAISGRGYADVVAAASVFEPLQSFLKDHIDSTWGTIGISLVGLELLSPVILAVTLALTPKTMDALQSKLNELGWGEEDLDSRVDELLGRT
eukprot:CAMPEP_0178930188 /NCGR_PEP_ID=MMETSP0786-20121207/21072_1 /TAXON_ID=186022 /ORGANISM="Thalassionema frauenfeldii, Strain CCMP 1798" /LENGTH=230 /DNA_ID=CAMNT_0020606639 /DNA_START=23 /DNA_END=715 /DNA_ORIENTATION=-